MGLEGVSQAQAVTVSLKELIDGAYLDLSSGRVHANLSCQALSLLKP